MKATLSFLIFATLQLASVAEDTNILLMSEWSKPVSLQNEQLHTESVRGRLVIVQGMEPAYGGPSTINGAMTFVELQNVTGACCGSIEVCFDVMKLDCKLTDHAGKAVPLAKSGGWGGRGAFAPCWVDLPYNATVRLFVNGGTMEPLSLYTNGVPSERWSIASSDTNTYFLTGSLNIFTRTNLNLSTEFREMDFKLYRTATLEFPKVTITPGKIGNRQPPKSK